jgi:hypothetical protein
MRCMPSIHTPVDFQDDRMRRIHDGVGDYHQLVDFPGKIGCHLTSDMSLKSCGAPRGCLLVNETVDLDDRRFGSTHLGRIEAFCGCDLGYGWHER